jgi:glutathione peroxidase
MKIRIIRYVTSLTALALPLMFSAMAVKASECADIFDQTRQRLHSTQTVDLCELTAGKTVLVVNTASNCGFTPHFKSLELLNQRYKDLGLVVIGFPSDDFFQEEDDEAETAKVCYINFGVTFTMLQPGSVRGSDADPIFKQLAEKSGTSPKWNFYKYLVTPDGEVVDVWSPRTAPDDAEFVDAVKKQLALR